MRSVVSILAVVGTVGLLGLSSCVSTDQHRRVVAANDALQKQLEDLQGRFGEQDGLIQDLRAKNGDLSRRAMDADFIDKQKAELDRLIREFKQSGGSGPSLPGVSVVQTAEGPAFHVQGEVLFGSGQADLTPGGKTTLTKILPHLKGREIRVSGHTDADPIRMSKWKTNLNLSVHRGLNVAEYLIEQGLPSGQVSVAGCGPNKPVKRGNAAADKAANRRVEILLVQTGH